MICISTNRYTQANSPQMHGNNHPIQASHFKGKPHIPQEATNERGIDTSVLNRGPQRKPHPYNLMP